MSSTFLNLTSLLYVDVTPAPDSTLEHVAATSVSDDPPFSPAPEPGLSEADVQARIYAACLAERTETEQRLEQQHTQKIASIERGVASAIAAFADERSTYFARVESEVVHLSLSIARKILEREAKTDPLLLAGLIRVALDGLRSSSAVRLRVSPDRLSAWQAHFGDATGHQRPELLSDASLPTDECVLETEAGIARLNFEVQLKEIERGFLDLLGQRPDRVFNSACTA